MKRKDLSSVSEDDEKDGDYQPNPKKVKEDANPLVLTRVESLPTAYAEVNRALLADEMYRLKFDWTKNVKKVNREPDPFEELPDKPLLNQFIYYMAYSTIRKQPLYEIFLADLRRNIEAGQYYRTLKRMNEQKPQGGRKETFLQILSTLINCTYIVARSIRSDASLEKEENPLLECPTIEGTDDNKRILFDSIARCFMVLCIRGIKSLRQKIHEHAVNIRGTSNSLETALMRRTWPPRGSFSTMQGVHLAFAAEELSKCMKNSSWYATFWTTTGVPVLCTFSGEIESFVDRQLGVSPSKETPK